MSGVSLARMNSPKQKSSDVSKGNGIDRPMKKPIIKEEITAMNIWRHYPKSDWSKGSYHDTMRKAADAKRKKYGTTTTYNGY